MTAGSEQDLLDAVSRSARAKHLGEDLGMPRLPSSRGPIDSLQGGPDASHTDPIFNHAASAVAGKPVVVRCWSRRDWPHLIAQTTALDVRTDYSDADGLATAGGRVAELAPGICDYLDTVALGGLGNATGRTALGLGFAITTLAHEAEHLRGVANENQTQCYAIQMIPLVARKLGLPTPEAHTLSQIVWSAYEKRLLGYWTPKCKKGGAYDLHPQSSNWP